MIVVNYRNLVIFLLKLFQMMFHFSMILRYRLNIEKAEWIIYVTDVGQSLHFDMFFSVSILFPFYMILTQGLSSHGKITIYDFLTESMLKVHHKVSTIEE